LILALERILYLEGILDLINHMNPIFQTNIPEGFHSITPYIFSDDAATLIEFLKKALYAEQLGLTVDDKGVIRNCVLRMGNTNFMISQAHDDFMGMRTALYLYVDDPDAVYQNAVDHGATEVFAPKDMDYGDRQGGIKDVSGNYWWISKHLGKGAYK